MRARTLIVAVLIGAAFVDVSCRKKEKKPDIAALARTLRNPDERGRTTLSLIEIGQPAAGPTADLLKDPDAGTRLAAAQVLWALGARSKDEVPALTAALDDAAAEVRATAAMALESIGPPASPAVSALAARMRDKDWNVRQHAAKALGAIGPAAKAAVPALIHAAKDDFTRSAATEALQKIQGPH